MNRDNELSEAIEEVFINVNEGKDFKKRLKRLIANAMEDSYLDDDILAIMNLMEKEE